MKRQHNSRRALQMLLLLLAVSGLFAQIAMGQKKLTSPEEFFGFRLGSDRKIARWDKIVDYFKRLETESGKIKVVNMGPTTMGNPFLLVIISAEANLSNLDRLQAVNARLSDPREQTESEIEGLIREGKAVVCQSMSLHATEIGGVQMTPELTYDLLAREDEETTRILENVVFLLIPSFNPDGQIMVTDWYNNTLGTEYEGAGLPWLYHKYAGHDNNRDGDFLNLVESTYAAQILYREWIPQAYLDHHHMGSYGARFYIPPYCDPIRPYADPLIWREMSWYGAHIAYKLEENGKTGILNAAEYPGWGHFGWHWITPFHNIAGMLTESASANLATPVYVHPEQLEGDARQFPEYKAQSTFPHPWPGGWWRLRDVVEQKKIAAWALLDLAARNKETVLRNAYLKAKRQTERGAEGHPKAYVVPANQHDPLTMVKMINTLLLSGVEIKQAKKDIVAGNAFYPEGSFLISLAQPKMGLVRNLLGKTIYPDNYWTRDKENGNPLEPYDLATHTMNEFMGVRVDPVDEAIDDEFEILSGQIPVAGKVDGDGVAYVLDGRLNASFKAVNLLLEKGIQAKRIDKAGLGLRPGDFIVSGSSKNVLEEIAAKTGVGFKALNSEIDAAGAHEVKRLRLGMYQRYYGGNMDEGWTRLLLETFSFPYTSLMDAEIKKGNLRDRYDVIILPDDRPELIRGEIPERYRRFISAVPPEYRSGIDQEGIDALKDFVEKGGTLVTLGQACGLAIDKFSLRVRNVVADLPSKEFFCPGSTLKVDFDNTHPLAYGMPSEGLILFNSDQAFDIQPGQNNEIYETVVRYPERDLLQSGWLIGEKHLSGKPAMIRAKMGKGQVILFGFPPQHRSQTHGTFKLFFNALLQ